MKSYKDFLVQEVTGSFKDIATKQAEDERLKAALADKQARERETLAKKQAMEKDRLKKEEVEQIEELTDYDRRRMQQRDPREGDPTKNVRRPKNPQNDYFARRKKQKANEEVEQVVNEEHPELKKIRDEYEKYEGKGTFDHSPHVYSDDNRVWERGHDLHTKYTQKRHELKQKGEIKEDQDVEDYIVKKTVDRSGKTVSRKVHPRRIVDTEGKEEMKEQTEMLGFVDYIVELTDKQKKIDKNHNGKLDAQDFKILRKEATSNNADYETCPKCGKDVDSCAHSMAAESCSCTKMKEQVEEGVKNNPDLPRKHTSWFVKPPKGSRRFGKEFHMSKEKEAHDHAMDIGGSVHKMDQYGSTMKEDVEQVDELNKSTLKSYIKKASSDMFRKGTEAEARFRGKDISGSMKTGKKADIRQKGIDTAVEKVASARTKIGEDVELDEAFINGREYASHGLMHPEHAGSPMHKVTGKEVDFYAHGTGDKIQGKVTMNNGKHVHIRANKSSGGKLHTFKVTPHLPKEANEEVEITEEALGDHAKLRSYADKRGGMDKKDLHTAANHIESGNVSALKKHLNSMDTDPRDKVLDHVNKSHWKSLGYSSMHEEQIEERELSTAEMNKREEVVKSMKKSYKDFKDRYGSRAKEVMYATATNVAKKSK